MKETNWLQQVDATLTDLASMNVALKSKPKMVKIRAMAKLVQLGLHDEKTILELHQLSKCLDEDTDTVLGTWMLGHFSMAALYEICRERNLNAYNAIFDSLDEDNQYIINGIIERKHIYDL